MELDEDTGNMACCDICERWIHMRCDPELSEERLEELEQDNESYACPLCSSRLKVTLAAAQNQKSFIALETDTAADPSRFIVIPEMETAGAHLLTFNGSVA
ncbi:hypothetical protein BDF19DRAFT_58172 [Syncephalis fuscata]|nr:hypothetical protein BDF19DRAFT_58172 [Syncephalis fuscata]